MRAGEGDGGAARVVDVLADERRARRARYSAAAQRSRDLTRHANGARHAVEWWERHSAAAMARARKARRERLQHERAAAKARAKARSPSAAQMAQAQARGARLRREMRQTRQQLRTARAVRDRAAQAARVRDAVVDAQAVCEAASAALRDAEARQARRWDAWEWSGWASVWAVGGVARASVADGNRKRRLGT